MSSASMATVGACCALRLSTELAQTMAIATAVTLRYSASFILMAPLLSWPSAGWKVEAEALEQRLEQGAPGGQGLLVDSMGGVGHLARRDVTREPGTVTGVGPTGHCHGPPFGDGRSVAARLATGS